MRGLRTFFLVATLAVAQVALARAEGPGETSFITLSCPIPGVQCTPPSDGVTPSGGVAVRKQETGRPRGTATFAALQMNLCDSGIAGCFTGRAAGKAVQVVLERAPALVTVNEACESEVTERLLPAMLALYPNEWVFWTFAPAAHRGTDEPVRCTPDSRGNQRGRFGNGMVGRLFTGSDPRFSFDGGLFPDDRPAPDELQDRAHAELRSWICAEALYRACTAHLDNPSATGAGTAEQGRVASNQCRHLTGTVATGRPTVVVGDLNLGADADTGYSVRGCAPAGWSRHGDGAVQHALAGKEFGTATVAVVPMDDTTDHPALLVSYRPAFATVNQLSAGESLSPRAFSSCC
jgi:hypothetical protein